jgi:glycosyltransferase involved in cell wall biosynthesis
MTGMSGTGLSLTVVVATYNVGALIENCILSVIAQTHRDIELLIIDGGSTDGTLAVLEKYRDRIRWISEKDKGLNDAQRKGVALAAGEWIFFLGADDVLASPKAIENLFSSCPTDLSAYDIITGHALYEDGRLYRSNRPWLLRIKNCIHGQGALYRRRLFTEKAYDMSLRVYYDYDFNLWALTSGKKFVHTSILLAVLGCGGHSDRPRWKNYREDMRTRAKYVKGMTLLATNVVAVGRYLYKVAWFRILRSI